MKSIIYELKSDLVKNSAGEYRKSSERYFRENVKLYGVKATDLHKLETLHYKALTDKSKANIFKLCETLFESGMMEEALIACMWSDRVHKQYHMDDIRVFEKWVNKYVSNWAVCDTLCCHSVGDLLMMYPPLVERLGDWARSANRWSRRASAVSLILPARKGLFINEIFIVAEILLSDKDDMVQKGYGWMLKEASKPHLSEVYDFVLRNKLSMPRTSLRYAIEKMPAEMKAEAMRK